MASPAGKVEAALGARPAVEEATETRPLTGGGGGGGKAAAAAAAQETQGLALPAPKAQGILETPHGKKHTVSHFDQRSLYSFLKRGAKEAWQEANNWPIAGKKGNTSVARMWYGLIVVGALFLMFIVTVPLLGTGFWVRSNKYFNFKDGVPLFPPSPTPAERGTIADLNKPEDAQAGSGADADNAKFNVNGSAVVRSAAPATAWEKVTAAFNGAVDKARDAFDSVFHRDPKIKHIKLLIKAYVDGTRTLQGREWFFHRNGNEALTKDVTGPILALDEALRDEAELAGSPAEVDEIETKFKALVLEYAGEKVYEPGDPLIGEGAIDKAPDDPREQPKEKTYIRALVIRDILITRELTAYFKEVKVKIVQRAHERTLARLKDQLVRWIKNPKTTPAKAVEAFQAAVAAANKDGANVTEDEVREILESGEVAAARRVAADLEKAELRTLFIRELTNPKNPKGTPEQIQDWFVGQLKDAVEGQFFKAEASQAFAAEIQQDEDVRSAVVIAAARTVLGTPGGPQDDTRVAGDVVDSVVGGAPGHLVHPDQRDEVLRKVLATVQAPRQRSRGKQVAEEAAAKATAAQAAAQAARAAKAQANYDQFLRDRDANNQLIRRLTDEVKQVTEADAQILARQNGLDEERAQLLQRKYTVHFPVVGDDRAIKLTNDGLDVLRAHREMHVDEIVSEQGRLIRSIEQDGTLVPARKEFLRRAVGEDRLFDSKNVNHQARRALDRWNHQIPKASAALRSQREQLHTRLVKAIQIVVGRVQDRMNAIRSILKQGAYPEAHLAEINAALEAWNTALNTNQLKQSVLHAFNGQPVLLARPSVLRDYGTDDAAEIAAIAEREARTVLDRNGPAAAAGAEVPPPPPASPVVEAAAAAAATPRRVRPALPLLVIPQDAAAAAAAAAPAAAVAEGAPPPVRAATPPPAAPVVAQGDEVEGVAPELPPFEL